MILGNIRCLFLERKRAYTLREAATLLAMTSRDLRGWIEAGELEGKETRDGLLLPWSELEHALGDDLALAMAIPELLRACVAA